MGKIINVKSISELHQFFGNTKPKHPLITIIDFSNPEYAHPNIEIGATYVLNFYCISLKDFKGVMKYGRGNYDFEEGTMAFLSPGQVITTDEEPDTTVRDMWGLFFHPDLIRYSTLADKMSGYSFFSYETNEALHISEEEKETIEDCLDKVKKEIALNTDKHSQPLIVSNLELMLNYCTRFYDRQFITRTNFSKDTISEFEKFLTNYFKTGQALELGLLTVKMCADKMNLSTNYLSDLLKKETGKNTQEHIHYLVIEQAKNKLLSTTMNISEIAYGLGFEYPGHFSKIFKSKVGMSPVEYRNLN